MPSNRWEGKGKEGPDAPPSHLSPVIQKNLKTIMDTNHAHAHNSHKVVLRAFLQSDTRESEISDVVGVLKLKVGDAKEPGSESPLHGQTLLLASDKRSEAVSAKAAMRSSRSPNSRTFFIHAVDPRNLQSWMLEVVLQIERSSQSALVKFYEQKNAALRQDLRAHGAVLNKHVSEIDAVRALLADANKRLERERVLRVTVEQMHGALEVHGGRRSCLRAIGVLVCDAGPRAPRGRHRRRLASMRRDKRRGEDASRARGCRPVAAQLGGP